MKIFNVTLPILVKKRKAGRVPALHQEWAMAGVGGVLTLPIKYYYKLLEIVKFFGKILICGIASNPLLGGGA